MNVIQNITANLDHLDKINGLKLKIQKSVLTELARPEYDDLCGYSVSRALTELAEKFAANDCGEKKINAPSPA